MIKDIMIKDKMIINETDLVKWPRTSDAFPAKMLDKRLTDIFSLNYFSF